MTNSQEFTEENIRKLFGSEAAEDEEPSRLREYYFKSVTYNQVISNIPVRILVGHKGIGKSALFTVAVAEETEKGNLAIVIKPNDITGINLHDSDFFKIIKNWQDGLNEIIIRKSLLKINLELGTFLTEFVDFGGGVTNFLTRIFKRLVINKSEIADNIIVKNFLVNPKVLVFIDDLDRGWKAKTEDITRISALLNAVRDISNDDRKISFKIALRSDVYYLVRTSDESMDKIDGSVIWHSWTNHEILIVLLKRIATYFNKPFHEGEFLSMKPKESARYLDLIMQHNFTGSGKWSNAPMYRILMSLIRKRPRDLVKLCSLAAKEAYIKKSLIITTENFQSILNNYSLGRLQDTINEYQSELPEIARLVMNMKPNKRERSAKKGYTYSTDELLRKVVYKPLLSFGGYYFHYR